MEMTREAQVRVLIATLLGLAVCTTRLLPQTQPVELKGAVTKVEFLNPSVDFYFTVGDGADKQWKCVSGTPASLKRIGWKDNSLSKGDEVTISGDLSENGSHLSVLTLIAKRLRLPNAKAKAGEAAPAIACDLTSPAK